MPYDRAADIVRLAIRLQKSWSGLTLDDVQHEFEVSRRTAERLRDAVEDVVGPLETVDTREAKRHYRLRTRTLRHLVSISADELAEFTAASERSTAPAWRSARSCSAASTKNCWRPRR